MTLGRKVNVCFLNGNGVALPFPLLPHWHMDQSVRLALSSLLLPLKGLGEQTVRLL